MPEMKTLTVNGVKYDIRDPNAAPNGFGLGTECTDISGKDLLTEVAQKSGFYRGSNVTHAPNVYWWYYIVTAGADTTNIIAFASGNSVKITHFTHGDATVEWADFSLSSHTHTAADVSAAPSGFGLGEATGRSCGSDPNTAIRPGFYMLGGENSVNCPTEYYYFKWGVLLVQRRYDVIEQKITYKNVSAVRHSADGGESWEPWEYENPPMELGKEYRTTERWNGLPVYVKLVDCGTLPNASTKTVPHGASATQILRCLGQCLSNHTPIPREWNGGNIQIFADRGNVLLTTNVDYSDQNAYAQIWYTKD